MPNSYLQQLHAPHLDQYFGVWAIKPDVFTAAVDRVNRMDLGAHIANWRKANPDPDALGPSGAVNKSGQLRDEWIREGVATFDIEGPLMKHISSFDDGTSTVALRRGLRAAVNDERVKSILLRIDSPGGTVAGTADLAADIRSAATQKPVVAFIEDLGASAAYWLAAQASQVLATETSIVGSIGTFAVLYDLSQAAKKAGIEVHVIKAGEFKGAGTPGTEITGEQLEEFQGIVNALNAFFVRDVAKGRGLALNDARELADGRVQVGKDAMSSGLIDGIATADQAFVKARRWKTAAGPTADIQIPPSTDLTAGEQHQIATLIEKAAERSTARSADSAERTDPVVIDTTKPKERASAMPADDKTGTDALAGDAAELVVQSTAATVAELKAAFPDATAEFREQCLEREMTIEQAKSHYIDHLRAANEAKAGTIEELQAKADAPNKGKGGEPVTAGGSPPAATDADPIAAWEAHLAKFTTGGRSKMSAMSLAVKADGDLHKAYLTAYNEQSRRSA